MITSNFNSYCSAVCWDVNWWLQSAAGSFGREAKQEACSITVALHQAKSRQESCYNSLFALTLWVIGGGSRSYCVTLGKGGVRHKVWFMLIKSRKEKGLCAEKEMVLNHPGKRQVFSGYCAVLWTIDSNSQVRWREGPVCSTSLVKAQYVAHRCINRSV